MPVECAAISGRVGKGVIPCLHLTRRCVRTEEGERLSGLHVRAEVALSVRLAKVAKEEVRRAEKGVRTGAK